ncbi:MAG TPA: extracellular solute-binding protein [Chloroflexia bacterium]|nr:extracellular solute-binding protein [Chloroflexia bacterium]
MRTNFRLRKWVRPNALLLGVFLLSLSLVACGGENATSTPASGTTVVTSPNQAGGTVTGSATSSAEPNFTPAGQVPTAASSTPAPVALLDPNLKTTLVIWEALPDSQSTALKELVTAFGKAYPGVKVTSLHYDPAEISDTVDSAAASGKLPDLILASGDYVTDFNGSKALQSADKLFDKTFLDSFAANALNASNLNGNQWGIPFTYSGTPVMLYNKKLVPDAPQTWDELGKVVQPLYNAKNKQIGLALEVNEPYFLTAMLGGFGGAVLDSQNKPTLDTSQMTATLAYIQQLLKDKTVRAESRLKDNQIDYAFRDGRLGIYIGDDGLISQYATAISSNSSDSKLDLGVAPLPKINSTGNYPVPFSDSKSFFIGANSSGDHLNAAKDFLQWMAKPEQQATILSKAMLLPATKSFLSSDAVTKNPIWNGLFQQLEVGKAQPSALEMRGVWDALRPELESVVAGTLNPSQAAKQMQQIALDNVSKLAVK